MSLGISALVIAAVFTFYLPMVVIYDTLMNVDSQKNNVLAAMDTIEREVSDVVSVYVDPAACWEICMVDPQGNRIFYYWDPAAEGTYKSLYRKKEAATNAIACTGGNVFLRNLDSTVTNFSVIRSLLTANLAGKSDYQNSTTFQAVNTFFPSLKERSILFSEGFECASLASGWTVSAGDSSTWTIEQTSTGLGKYQVVDTMGGETSNTTSIEVPIDLARTSSANVSFSYMNDGSIGVPDVFTVQFYDGTTWQTVFEDSSGLLNLTPKTVTADLSGYTLSASNKLRFVGTLKTTGSHWYVDQVSVYTP